VPEADAVEVGVDSNAKHFKIRQEADAVEGRVDSNDRTSIYD
jgi:hypothetical protein